MQQGGRPTPFDRNMGTKTAAKSLNWLVQQLNVEGALFILFYQINSFWIFEYVVLRCIRCWKRHGFHKVQDIVLFAGTACQGLPVPAHCRPKVRDRLPGKEEKDAYFACRIEIVHSASDPANCRQAILRRLFLFSSSGDGNMFGGSRPGPSWESWPSTTLLTQLRVKLSNRLTK